MQKTLFSALSIAALALSVTAAGQDAAPAAGTPGVFAPVAAPSGAPSATFGEGTADIIANPAGYPIAATDNARVMSFTVPVTIPQSALQQQTLQQPLPGQPQYPAPQYGYPAPGYEEQLLARQEYARQQQAYARQYAVRQQQLAAQRDRLQEQMRLLAEQRDQLSSQAAALQQEMLALGQQPAAFAAAPLDPNAPVQQPPMGAQTYTPLMPAQASPLMPMTGYTALPPMHPLPAADFMNTLRNPSRGGDEPVVSLITPAEVRAALRSGVQLIMLDVRAPLVREVEGLIAGSVSVPYDPSATFASRLQQVLPRTGPNYPVIVFCSDGTTSAIATGQLAKLGYAAYCMGAYRLWVGY